MNDKNNSLTTFENYYKENLSFLIRFAQRFVPLETAEDAIHDLFLDIWDNSDNHSELPSRSYLFTSVRNRCINILTREQVKRNYIETVELNNRNLGLEYYSSYEKQIIDKEEIEIIFDEIEKLPEKCRQTFKLSYIEEKNNSEIAKIQNISIRTVEHHLYLGLRTLRERLTSKK